MSQKESIRQNVRTRIDTLTPEQRIVSDAHIGTQITHLPYWDEADVVVGYIAMDDEVDLQAALRVAARDGKAVALPRVVGDEMSMHIIETFPGLLERHPFGFLQPSEGAPPADDLSRAVTIVPGRAFDRSGHRIGRGRGYYDRFLQRIGSGQVLATIGVCYAVQFQHEIPVEPWDVAVQIVITESETCFCNRP